MLVGGTTLVLMAALVLPLRYLLLRDYVELEREMVSRNVARAENAIALEIDGLATVVRDYAVWDDTYAFLGGEAPEYPAVNLTDETLAHNRLSLVALLDVDGEPRFQKEYDLRRGRARARRPLASSVRALCAQPEGCVRSGVVETSDGPMLVAAHAVLTSADRGPARGVLVIGRRLDEEEVAQIGQTVGLALAIAPAPSGAIPRVETVSDERIAGSAVLDDAFGAPYLVARIEMAREIHARGVMGTWSVAISIAAAGVVLALVVFLLVDRAVLRRVAQLSSDVARVSESADPAVRVGVRGDDELAGLAVGINGMLAELARARAMIREAFGRYVSEDVAEVVLSTAEGPVLGGQTREVTILFSDIRGYSTISEHMAPTEVVDLLNEYFGAMSEVIEAEGGCVIEFLGDAILAVFGAPGDLSDHAERATRAALAMRGRGDELNRAWVVSGRARMWRDRGVDSLSSRIGLHTGKVVAGNVGSATRMKYAVIGDSVNTAARVEALNGTLGTDVLVTAEVRERLGPELSARAEDRGAHAVKGRERPVHVFSIPRAR